MSNIKDVFGSMVFNDSVMKEKLPHEDYKALKRTIQSGHELDRHIADVVANAMKNWAIEKGATHFTHWFQPMTGITAEKHDAFITPVSNSEVVTWNSPAASSSRANPDASSFPSGGLRATFEARGYTAWDPTSYAFIKDRTLCIPTAYCAFTGQVLDKKTPAAALHGRVVGDQALRILRLFGDTRTQRVIPTAGPEQEYFLIDQEMYARRPDLKYTGRTLMGARPAKGQELDDQYFGALKSQGFRFYARSGRRAVEAGRVRPHRAQRGRPGAARARPRVHQRERGLRPQPADHGADEEGRAHATVWPACCTKSPLPASTAAASTTTGRCAPTRAKTCSNPGKTPREERAQFLLFLARGDPRGGRASGSAARVGGHARATTTAWAATRRRRPSCPCSWATS